MSTNVLITGHTSGIGAALTKSFLSNGCSVYGIARTLSPELPTCNQLQFDLSTPLLSSALVPFFDNISFDVFIHCAGYNPIIPLLDISHSDLIANLNVHCLSALTISQLLISKHSNVKPLKIMLVSSIWSNISAPNRYIYSSTKSCLDTLSRSIAIEHSADSVFSLSLCLGFVDSPLTSLTTDDPHISSARNRYLPLKNNSLPSSEIVADQIFKLSKLDLTLLNGSSIPLHGGICYQ